MADAPNPFDKKNIVLVGDSHMEGTLGKALEKKLKTLGAASVKNLGVGSTTGKMWADAAAGKVAAVTPKVLLLAQAWNIATPGAVIRGRNEFDNPKSTDPQFNSKGPKPWHHNINEATSPTDILLISLGTNDGANAAVGSTASQQTKESDARKSVDFIKSINNKINAKEVWWIGPPMMMPELSKTKPSLYYTKENINYIYVEGKKTFGDKAIDSLSIPGDSDGIHTKGPTGEKWAQLVIDKIIGNPPKTAEPPPPAPLPAPPPAPEKSQQDAVARIGNTDPDGRAADIFASNVKSDSDADAAVCAANNRLSEQAALILTIDKILKSIEANQPTSPTKREYKNFTTIRYSDNIQSDDTPTGHFFLTNILTKSPSTQTFFRDLPPQILSFLIPSIKIFKTYYENTNGVNQLEAHDWQIPFDDVPLKFDKFTSEYVAKNAEEIFNGNGSFNAVGIKSFSYEFRGVNPAEIDTNIHSSIELYFQNPVEMTKRIQFTKDDPRWIIPPKSEPTKGYNFSYSDLINSLDKRDKITNEINDQYYRIKIQCGYTAINEPALNDLLSSAKVNNGQGYKEDEIKKIIKTIKETQIILFLSPYSYNLSFNDEGTITLKIDFNSSMDSIMSSNHADIFKLSPITSNLEKVSEVIKNMALLKEKQSKPGDPPNQESSEEEQCIDKEKIDKILSEFKTLYKNFPFDQDPKKHTDQLLELLDDSRRASYNILYEYLTGKYPLYSERRTAIDAGKTIVTSILPKIYVARFTPAMIGFDPKQGKATTAINRIKALNSGNALKEVFGTFADNEIFMQKNQAEKDEHVKTQIADSQSKGLESALSYLDKKMAYSLKNSNGQIYYNVKFILLGDLIDIVLDVLNKIEPIGDAPKIVVGNIPILLPIGELSKKENSAFMTNSRQINPNLADIPISLNLLQEFLIKNIVKDGKTRYPVLQFIKDIISQLIYPAISPSILGRPNVISSPIRFSTSYYTFPVDKDGNDLISQLPAERRQFLPIIDKIKVENLKKFRDGNNGIITSADRLDREKAKSMKNQAFSNYVFLTCTSRFPAYIKGNEEEDVKQGLMHIRMGTEGGIVKKVSFEKMNSPQREMFARREGSGFGTTLKQFYNATVEMYGNNIFLPGDYIFIHPNYIYRQTDAKASDNKTPTNYLDLEDALGIGGYYLIIDVKSSIGIGSYFTTIKCVFQASRIKVKNGYTVKDNTAETKCVNK